MKITIVKLNILIDSKNIQNSTEVVPQLMSELNENISNVVESFGFEPVDFNPRISNRNGGWAFYRTYVLERFDKALKLVVDIRTANHPSRPSLSEKNAKRESALAEDFDSADIKTKAVDIYYKDHDSGVHYYIGKGDKYSQPIASLELLDNIVKSQLEKLITTYLS